MPEQVLNSMSMPRSLRSLVLNVCSQVALDIRVLHVKLFFAENFITLRQFWQIYLKLIFLSLLIL